ncbi:hypothetical protein [Veronia nyctiphanis]|nr:hypothetical protein [Veronia nyctiphanis]
MTLGNQGLTAAYGGLEFGLYNAGRKWSWKMDQGGADAARATLVLKSLQKYWQVWLRAQWA